MQPLSNLLNDVSLFGFTVLFKKWAREKKWNDTVLKKKAEEKQNSATTMTSVDGKQTVFPKKVEITREIVLKTY